MVAAYEYDPFGRTISSSGAEADSNMFGFSTKYSDDESGLAYYGYRYYDADTGRWPSRDPIGEQGGLNLYGFVRNRPVLFYDLLGRTAYTEGEWDTACSVYAFAARTEAAAAGLPAELRDCTGCSIALTDVGLEYGFQSTVTQIETSPDSSWGMCRSDGKRRYIDTDAKGVRWCMVKLRISWGWHEQTTDYRCNWNLRWECSCCDKNVDIPGEETDSSTTGFTTEEQNTIIEVRRRCDVANPCDLWSQPVVRSND
jgi:RHS repeat-associated protein